LPSESRSGSPASGKSRPRSPGLSLRPLWLLLPLVFLGCYLVSFGRTSPPSSPPPRASAAGARARAGQGRLVVLLVDSLRAANVADASLMPTLHALSLAPGTTSLAVRSCASNFSLPCIQTIFSGRESPMSAGLEQFSTYGGGGGNLVADASAAGLRVAIVGNEMVTTLYGRQARYQYSVEPLRLDALAADLAAVEQARRYLTSPDVDVLVLHTAGTDHVTHYDLPGSRGYREHFRRVDAALAPLVASLDLQRDWLVVMGDHGHDEDGHHTRETVALVAGAGYRRLFDQLDVPGRIEQKDLLFLLSYPGQLALGPEYEGRYFAPRHGVAPDSRLEAYFDVQRTELAAWMDGRAVATRMGPGWQPGDARAKGAVMSALGPLLCFLAWIVRAWRELARGRLSPWPAVGAAVGAFALGLASRAGAPSVLLAVLPAGALVWLAWRHAASRLVATVGLLVAAAALTAWIEPSWRSFFHSRDEFHWGIPLFYAVMLGAGATVAALRGRRHAWPWATQLAAFIGLPVGVYYYQFDENPLRAYLIPAALVAAWIAVRRRSLRPTRATLAVGVTALLLLPQDAGGWQWHPWLAMQLAGWPTPLTFAVLLAVSAWLVSLLPTWRTRATMAAVLFALAGYVLVATGLDWTRFAAGAVVVLFLSAWLAAGRDVGEGGEQAGLMLAAAAVVIALTTCDGFLVEHIDFTFALGYGPGNGTDGLVLLAVALPVAVKYAGWLFAAMAFHRLLAGAAASERAVGYALLFLTFKLLGLLVQALVGALDTGEKFFELAQTHFIFVACLLVVFGLWTVVLWAADRASSQLSRLRRVRL
jgi:hypothetical protein